MNLLVKRLCEDIVSRYMNPNQLYVGELQALGFRLPEQDFPSSEEIYARATELLAKEYARATELLAKKRKQKRTGNDVYITLDDYNAISIVVFPVEGSDEGRVILPLTLAEASLLQSQIADAIYRVATEWTEVKP